MEKEFKKVLVGVHTKIKKEKGYKNTLIEKENNEIKVAGFRLQEWASANDLNFRQKSNHARPHISTNLVLP